MKEINIHIPIHPRSYQGHEIGKSETDKAFLYSPKEKQDYIDSVALLAIQIVRANAKKAGKVFRRFEGGPVHADIVFSFATEHRELWGTDNLGLDVPDLDNMLKPLFDAMEPRIVENDRIITRINARKIWADKSGIDIRLVDAS